MARPIREPVDPGPFTTWLDGLPESHPGAMKRLLANAWGLRDDSALRRLHRWRHETSRVEREQVEQAIEALDPEMTFSCLYGEAVPRTPTGRRRRQHAGVPITVPEDVLIEAHRLHLDEGLSFRRLGVMLLERTYASSPKALANTLHNAFKQRGWETRSRTEAISQFNQAKRAHLPFCRHIHQAGPRKGQRCQKRTSRGWCWHHHPDNLRSRLSGLHALDAQRVAQRS